jgi:membrane protein YdbS with pleckstrin-like domain
MKQGQHIPTDTPFKPAPALTRLYTIHFILIILLILCFTALPILIATGTDSAFAAPLTGICVIVLVVIFFIWVRLYYASMWYELRNDELSWKRGVWFHRTGIVPYNRITNIDIVQGPVMRVLNISTLSIQTAGYSGKAVPEIRIEGVEHAEELRELLRSMVRSAPGTSDGTSGTETAPGTADKKILDELIKIRMLLELQKK